MSMNFKEVLRILLNRLSEAGVEAALSGGLALSTMGVFRFTKDIDFVVLEEGKPLFAVECKAGEKSIDPSIYYFMERTKIPRFYQVHPGESDFEKNGVRVVPVHTFCKELHLP